MWILVLGIVAIIFGLDWVRWKQHKNRVISREQHFGDEPV